MSKLTIALTDALDDALSERVKNSGAHSKEEYLVSLIEADCGAQTLDRVLTERAAGPFAPLEAGWKERVRTLAAARANG